MRKHTPQEGFYKQPDGYFTSAEFPLIRYKEVTDDDPMGKEYNDYRFEIYQRPYFFHLLGRKRWSFLVQTNSFTMGLSFSKYMTFKKKS
jgi:hypothetical protein